MKDEKLELLLAMKQEYKEAWEAAKQRNKGADVLRKIEDMRMKLDYAIIDYITNTNSDPVKSVGVGVPILPIPTLRDNSVCPTCNVVVRGAHYCPGPKAKTSNRDYLDSTYYGGTTL